MTTRRATAEAEGRRPSFSGADSAAATRMVCAPPEGLDLGSPRACTQGGLSPPDAAALGTAASLHSGRQSVLDVEESRTGQRGGKNGERSIRSPETGMLVGPPGRTRDPLQSPHFQCCRAVWHRPFPQLQDSTGRGKGGGTRRGLKGDTVRISESKNAKSTTFEGRSCPRLPGRPPKCCRLRRSSPGPPGGTRSQRHPAFNTPALTFSILLLPSIDPILELHFPKLKSKIV